MDVIDNMLLHMSREDPNFKPSGGRLGEDDMDYDTDEKSMAALRYQLRRAAEEYYRYKSEYISNVCEALELEDTIKNYERGSSTERCYISSFRQPRTGTFGKYLDADGFDQSGTIILKKSVNGFNKDLWLEKMLFHLPETSTIGVKTLRLTISPRNQHGMLMMLGARLRWK